MLVDAVTSFNQFNQIKQKQSHKYLEASSLSNFPLESDVCISESLALSARHEKPKTPLKSKAEEEVLVCTHLCAVPAGSLGSTILLLNGHSVLLFPQAHENQGRYVSSKVRFNRRNVTAMCHQVSYLDLLWLLVERAVGLMAAASDPICRTRPHAQSQYILH